MFLCGECCEQHDGLSHKSRVISDEILCDECYSVETKSVKTIKAAVDSKPFPDFVTMKNLLNTTDYKQALDKFQFAYYRSTHAFCKRAYESFYDYDVLQQTGVDLCREGGLDLSEACSTILFIYSPLVLQKEYKWSFEWIVVCGVDLAYEEEEPDDAVYAAQSKVDTEELHRMQLCLMDARGGL